MTATTDAVNISPAMVEALDIEGDTYTAGGIMAHAIRTAYATPSDPLAGISYGWTDEDPDALTFVVGLIESADEHDLPLDPDTIHEIADQAVPIYTAEVWAAATRLRDLTDDDATVELVANDATIEQRLAVGLYTVAVQILSALR